MNKISLLLAATFLISSAAQAEMSIMIDKHTQSYQLFDNGNLIKKGKVSTGRKGHETPSGVFTITKKFPMVISIKYDAPMPNALFFKGRKYAIHQGRLPGYPASHGCVRVSKNDSEYLFNMLDVGSVVVIR
jgi:lipoprotein-anchoring transpeptidase ErfK/SrfK